MSKNWASVDINTIPNMVSATVPGPKSVEYHERCSKYMKGYSSQVQLFPVTFESLTEIHILISHQVYM